MILNIPLAASKCGSPKRGSQGLPKAIPPHIAKDMILTGRAMDMHEAAAHGLVNYTAAKGEVMSKAREIAEQLCSVSPTAVAASMAKTPIE